MKALLVAQRKTMINDMKQDTVILTKADTLKIYFKLLRYLHREPCPNRRRSMIRRYFKNYTYADHAPALPTFAMLVKTATHAVPFAVDYPAFLDYKIVDDFNEKAKIELYNNWFHTVRSIWLHNKNNTPTPSYNIRAFVELSEDIQLSPAVIELLIEVVEPGSMYPWNSLPQEVIDAIVKMTKPLDKDNELMLIINDYINSQEIMEDHRNNIKEK